MFVKLKFSLIIGLFLSCLCHAQGGKDSLRLYQDVLYLGNIQYGSNNPTAISDSPLRSVTDININFLRSSGDFRLVDQSSREHWWSGSLFGIQRIGKITFEGDVSYENGKQTDRKWNSTLFIADDNPFIVADSLTGDYNVEKFRLNGGFSYEINAHWRAGLRAIYEVGSSADQTDPRPDIKGMRFLLNPGVDYQWGNFRIGASAGVRWLGESVNYTLVKTYEPHQLFLFRGMGNYESQQAIGFQRRYTGTAYQGNLQLGWNNAAHLADFLELGYEKSTEEAIDGSSSNKYKGGKYARTRFSLTNRFRISGERTMHNVTLEASHNKVEGTWYIQTQSSDADGNTVWEVKDASVCHIEKRTDASLTYRMDRMRQMLPHFTWEVKAGVRQSDIKNYPEVYLQKYMAAYAVLNACKNLPIKKSLLSIYLNGMYDHRLSSSFSADGLKLKTVYSLPAFETSAAAYCQGNIGAKAQVPLAISRFHSWLGVYAEYTLKHYMGDYVPLDGTNRNQLNVGVNLTF